MGGPYQRTVIAFDLRRTCSTTPAIASGGGNGGGGGYGFRTRYIAGLEKISRSNANIHFSAMSHNEPTMSFICEAMQKAREKGSHREIPHISARERLGTCIALGH